MHSFLIKTCFYALTNVHILHANRNDLNNHAHTLNPNLELLFRFSRLLYSLICCCGCFMEIPVRNGRKDQKYNYFSKKKDLYVPAGVLSSLIA